MYYIFLLVITFNNFIVSASVDGSRRSVSFVEPDLSSNDHKRLIRKICKQCLSTGVILYLDDKCYDNLLQSVVDNAALLYKINILIDEIKPELDSICLAQIESEKISIFGIERLTELINQAIDGYVQQNLNFKIARAQLHTKQEALETVINNIKLPNKFSPEWISFIRLYMQKQSREYFEYLVSSQIITVTD